MPIRIQTVQLATADWALDQWNSFKFYYNKEGNFEVTWKLNNQNNSRKIKIDQDYFEDKDYSHTSLYLGSELEDGIDLGKVKDIDFCEFE